MGFVLKVIPLYKRPVVMKHMLGSSPHGEPLKLFWHASIISRTFFYGSVDEG